MVDVDSWLEGLEIPGARNNYRLQESLAFQLSLDSTRQRVMLKSKQFAENPKWLVCVFHSNSSLLSGAPDPYLYHRGFQNRSPACLPAAPSGTYPANLAIDQERERQVSFRSLSIFKFVV